MREIRGASAGAPGVLLLLCLVTIFFGVDVSEARFLEGSSASKRPRGRPGFRPCSRIGTSFLDLESLGPHAYRFCWLEKNGIVYTCRGGFLDMAHVRGAIDRTAHLATKTLRKLEKNENEFSYKLVEPSIYFVRLIPPEDWADTPQSEKEIILRDVSIRLGQYFAYTACLWHEILTWFGYRSVGLYSEFHSAFTVEDAYSNVLGSHIGAAALRDAERPFNKAATRALARELAGLGAQTKQTAKRAMKEVQGQWFSGGLIFVKTFKRSFDTGLDDDDGYVTPWIVPSVSECKGMEARAHPAPNADFLSEYGFSLEFEIEPREWEKDKILTIVYPDRKQRRKRIDPAIHFPVIMDYIRKDAIERFGSNVTRP